jgi:pimeloyl-ACP methyl ester carboxylesterase
MPSSHDRSADGFSSASTEPLVHRRSVIAALGLAAAMPVRSWGAPAAVPVPKTFRTARHTTHYLEAGAIDGPLMMFLHGWPEQGIIWRAQMAAFAAKGWRCIAPDMRGYGSSSIPTDPSAYTHAEVVADMVELHDYLGGKPAVWVGHDWGSVLVGALAAHEPQRVTGAALISVPYFPTGNALPTLVPLIDRAIYPADIYPDGQWDYYRWYTTNFRTAVADLDADTASSLASIYRRGDPALAGKPAASAKVTRQGGRFGAAHRAPPTLPDPALWPKEDFAALVRSFDRNGFHGPCSWYLNDEANIAYMRRAPNGARLSMPVLFVNGDWDQINNVVGNRYGEPMRAACTDLTVSRLKGAHWLPLERKTELAHALAEWIHAKTL